MPGGQFINGKNGLAVVSLAGFITKKLFINAMDKEAEKMAIISTDHLKLYQGRSKKSKVLVLYGHGDIADGDKGEFSNAKCEIYFYVDEGKICNVMDKSLAAEIRDSTAVPLYHMSAGTTIPNYWIYKYRGREGFEASGHYSDDYYEKTAKQCKVDIIRVRHRYNNKKKRLKDIVDYAVGQGYATLYGLHCRFVQKEFTGLSPNKKAANYRAENTSRPKFRA